MVMARTAGVDFPLLPSPPLVDPPLSLLSLARTIIDVPDAIGTEREALEALATAQRRAEIGPDDPAEGLADARAAAAEVVAAQQDAITQAEAWVSEAQKRRAELERWEDGFRYLPSLGLLTTETFVYGADKAEGDDQPALAWYDPFEVVSRDERSLFGNLPYELRRQRALQSLAAHEAWQCEREFWSGVKVPTNLHLTASPASATTSAKRTIDAWPDPVAAPVTTLGTAATVKASLASLDEAIADSDAGVGMIHATPYLVQLWSSVYPFLRDSAGNLLTVNKNLIVPGYGYPGTGPDQADRTVTDGVTNSTTTVTSATAAFTSADVGRPISGAGIPAGTVIKTVTNATTVTMSVAATASAAGVHVTIAGTGGDATGSTLQWAYATDMVYKLKGPANVYPSDYTQQGTLLTQNNSAAVRAERPWALITNRLLRAAVLVDTTT